MEIIGLVHGDKKIKLKVVELHSIITSLITGIKASIIKNLRFFRDFY